MPVHTVKQGECLTTIAHEYGFSSHQDIYHHPQNSGLRRERSNPHVLLPGDEIYVPDPAPRQAACATGQAHRFVVKRPRRFVRLQLKHPGGKPLASIEYELTAGGIRKKGRTTPKGTLEEWVPVGAESCTLTLLPSGFSLQFRLGHLDPVLSSGDLRWSGIASRLHNLGYRCSAAEPEIRAALREFQQRALGRASPDGEPDDETLSALRERHGC